MAGAAAVVMAPELSPPAGRPLAPPVVPGAGFDAEDSVHTRSAEFTAPVAPKRSGRLVAVAVGGVLLAVGVGFALSGPGSEKAVPLTVRPLPHPVEAEEPPAPVAPTREVRPSVDDGASRETGPRAQAQGSPLAEAKEGVAATPPSAGSASPSTAPDASPPGAPAPEPVARPAEEKKPSPSVERKRPTVFRPVARGTLEFRIRPYAIVSLDGKVLGQTPLSAVEVTEGKHTLRLVNKELGKDMTRTVEVKAGQSTVFKLNLEAE